MSPEPVARPDQFAALPKQSLWSLVTTEDPACTWNPAAPLVAMLLRIVTEHAVPSTMTWLPVLL